MILVNNQGFRKRIALSRYAMIFILGYFITPPIVIAQPDVLDSLKRQLSIYTQEDTFRVVILNDLSYQYQWIDFDSSLHYAQQSLNIAERLRFSKGIVVANYRMGHCYWALGSSDSSIERTLLSIRLAKKENYTSDVAEGYRILAMNYRDQQELGKAETYIKQAEEFAKQDNNWELLARIYNFAGVIQFSKKNRDSAQLLYNKALSIIEEHPSYKFYLAQILSNLSDTYFDSNQVELGFKYLYEALSIAQKTRNRSAEAGILYDLGKAFTGMKQHAKANKYLTASLKLARELGLKRVIKIVYLALVDLKVQEKKSAEAIQYLTNYYEVRDSLLKTKEIAELEARSEAERKENAIALLEQEKRIQTMWTGILIIGSLLLLIALVIIYWLQKSRSVKAKQLLTIQQELNLKLKETDQLKSQFFANISHEFRTPLSLIIAPLEKQLSSPTTASNDKEDLKLAKRNANRLLYLINQLLDLSKLEVGKMNIQNVKGHLKEFINVLAASFDSFAETRKINFKKAIQIPSQSFLFDHDKLEKIISNILFNAFKFTPAGGAVVLSIYTELDNTQLHIKLTDTGKGIPEDELPQIFSLFYQSKNNTDDGQPGTGLGLAMVNELVKLYNGKISLASELNVGTTISISLPLQSDVPTADIEHPTRLVYSGEVTDQAYVDVQTFSEKTDSNSILIVEDNVELRNFVASTFTDNFNILTASDGEAGLQQALEHIPDLIISDVMMPKMDGLTLTEKLKNDERTSHIPIILLTAKTDTASRIEGFRKGADEYLAKPFSIEELNLRVNNLNELRKRLVSLNRENIANKVIPVHEPSLDEKFLLNLRAVIERNLGDASFSVEQLSKEMCLSRTQLFRKVKGMLELSPNELINDIRLQRAAELIRAKADTLTQISYSVGFNEQSYFAKRFRKKFGVSPSEYANTK